MNRFFEPPLRFADETSLVAAANVGTNRNLALVLAPGDDACAIHYCDIGKLGQGHAPSFVRGHHHVSDGSQVGAGIQRVADRDDRTGAHLQTQC